MREEDTRFGAHEEEGPLLRVGHDDADRARSACLTVKETIKPVK